MLNGPSMPQPRVLSGRHTQDLVSVVIPAVNAETTIGATLSSVRAQSHSLLDIIVVDDGSVDQTVAYAMQHARVDSRVRVISQSHGGVAAARNRGVTEATGEFVAFVD